MSEEVNSLPPLPEKWADDRLAIAAHAAWRGVTGATEAIAGWNALSAKQRVDWRAAADAVRMMLDMPRDVLTYTPIGYQGPAQHTYTTACDGFHEPGQCPRTDAPKADL